MLHRKVKSMVSNRVDSHGDRDTIITPIFGSEEESHAIPKYRLPERSMSPRTAYQIIHDECMLDGNARLNLATFVTTWMEPEARLTSRITCVVAVSPSSSVTVNVMV